MKRILFLGAPFECFKGGSEYQYKVIEERICNRFEIFYLFRYPDTTNNKKYITYNYILRRQYNEYIYSDAIIINRLIYKINPDIIYKRGINYITAVGVKYAKKNNKKSVIHVASDRDTVRFYPKLNKFILFEYCNSKLLKYVVKNASSIICQTKTQSDNLLHNYKRSGDIIIPNFHPLPFEKEIKKRPIRVIWVANLKKWKQPEIFIHLSERFQQNPNVEFIMIGRLGAGNWNSKLLKRISELENLTYLGELPIDIVNNEISKSHIFVNTSLGYEGFPNTYIQAWFRGVPVVTLNFDPDNVIKVNRLGFHSKTIEKLVKDIDILINNDELRRKMSQNVKKYSFQNHSVYNVEKIVKVFNT